MRRLSNVQVRFGEPLPIDVFNKEGMLLARAGSVVDDEEKYRDLKNFGYVEGGDQVCAEHAAPDPRAVLPTVGVMIADDTPLMLDMLEKSLRDIGIQRILRAEDGEIALARIGRYCPDLVFLDIDMPRRDGLSALKELREEFPALFVCMLSAHSSVQNVRTAMSAGASAFLVKPFHRDKLEGIILRYVEDHFCAAAASA